MRGIRGKGEKANYVRSIFSSAKFMSALGYKLDSNIKLLIYTRKQRRNEEKMKPTEDVVCVESIKHIMQIFSGKWAFLVMGELHTGPKRFNQINKSVGCSTKSLSDTLKLLETNGIIIRTVQPTIPVTVEYSLTEKGRDFENVFVEMRKWGEKWL